MAGTPFFQCSVVTPDRVVAELEARFVALPAWDGELGVLRGRAPLVVKLDIGTLRIETAQGTETFLIDGGFAEVVRDRVTVLTEEARAAGDLDRAAARKDLEEARALASKEDAEFAARQKALRKARQELRLLG